MAKSVGKTTGKVAVGRDAATGRLLVGEKVKHSHVVVERQGRTASGETEKPPKSTPYLRPQTVVVKQDQPAVAASADETYEVSMKAAEDVFARFDWTLSELAK
ncbi:hypothetical protein [Ensifer adhaerens]|uniref:hypothetical protein n=1 Tax=Ensifer adhaerens TaxID=106592 RepID=UPI00098EED2A|nr:hypothetical protein [Ensifer adhaerens]